MNRPPFSVSVPNATQIPTHNLVGLMLLGNISALATGEDTINAFLPEGMECVLQPTHIDIAPAVDLYHKGALVLRVHAAGAPAWIASSLEPHTQAVVDILAQAARRAAKAREQALTNAFAYTNSLHPFYHAALVSAITAPKARDAS